MPISLSVKYKLRDVYVPSTKIQKYGLYFSATFFKKQKLINMSRNTNNSTGMGKGTKINKSRAYGYAELYLLLNANVICEHFTHLS